MEDESARLGQAQLYCETGATEAGVPAERRLGAVAVIVAHPDIALPRFLEKYDSVSPDARAACRKRPDRLPVLQPRYGARCRVENDEVVSRAGHFVEVLALSASRHQILPVRLHQRRRQTIQIASRTIFFDILLTPSVRSTKMIGISKRLKPAFQAR